MSKTKISQGEQACYCESKIADDTQQSKSLLTFL